MSPAHVFGVQILFSVVVYSVVAVRWFRPWAIRRGLPEALLPLVVLHTLRTIGLFYALPGTLDDTVPRSVGQLIGYGDLLTASLALPALITLRRGSKLGLAFLWAFNIVGLVDLAQGGYLGMLKYEINIHSIPAVWWIVTFLVPALLITHVLMISLLLRPRTAAGTA
jgi:hypothetical protein